MPDVLDVLDVPDVLGVPADGEPDDGEPDDGEPDGPADGDAAGPGADPAEADALGWVSEPGASWVQAAMITRPLAGSALPPTPLRSTK